MNPTYPDSIKIEILINGDWLDISQYVIENIDADWGILNNTPIDRTGYIGGMSLLLNNNSGIFTPGTVNTLSGWQKGIKIRLVLTYEGIPYVRFKGKVKRIGLPYKVDEISVIPVTVSDWFDEAINKKFYLQAIETNKTTAEAVQIVLNNLANQPDNVDIEQGSEILDAVFTSTSTKATAYSELSKLALSEFSFTYLKKDRVYGETLKAEKRQSRIGRELTEFIKPKYLSPKLLLQNGSYLLLQNGSRLVLNKSTSLTIDNMYQMETEYGENLINELTVRSNPVSTDDTLQVLFSLENPIAIAPGQTLPVLKVSYKDPTGGGARINGLNMQTPEITTDYLMNTNADGSGFNLSAYLTVGVEYGSSGANYTLTNTNVSTAGYITKLQARGYGVYNYNPTELLLQDETSIAEFGIAPFTINNHYQSNTNITDEIGRLVLSQNKDNKTLPRKIMLRANISPDLMNAFLNLDVGDLIHVIQNQHQIDDNCFIHSVKYRIYQGGIIDFEWGLTDAYLANKNYWTLGVIGKSELGTTTVVSY